MAPVKTRAGERTLAVYLLVISVVLALLSGSFYLVGMDSEWAQAPLLVAISIWFGVGFWWAFREVSFLVTLLGMSFALMVLSGVFYVAGIPTAWARALFLATVIIWIVLGVAVMVQAHQERAAYSLRQRHRAAATGASEEAGDGGVDGGEGGGEEGSKDEDEDEGE